jgi:hypothetical protein
MNTYIRLPIVLLRTFCGGEICDVLNGSSMLNYGAEGTRLVVKSIDKEASPKHGNTPVYNSILKQSLDLLCVLSCRPGCYSVTTRVESCVVLCLRNQLFRVPFCLKKTQQNGREEENIKINKRADNRNLYFYNTSTV